MSFFLAQTRNPGKIERSLLLGKGSDDMCVRLPKEYLRSLSERAALVKLPHCPREEETGIIIQDVPWSPLNGKCQGTSIQAALRK